MSESLDAEQYPPVALTLRELIPALGDLGVDERTVATAFMNVVQQRAETRRQNELQTRWDNNVRGFAVAYHRTTNEHASASNIEGWHEELETVSVALLEDAAQWAEKSERRQRAIEAAAVTYAYFGAQRGELPDEDLLRQAGVESDHIYRRLKQGFDTVVNPDQDDGLQGTIDRMVPDWEGIRQQWPSVIGPDLYRATISPVAERVYADLQANGVVLPELGPDGRYPQEYED
jgi:hypothetical protein